MIGRVFTPRRIRGAALAALAAAFIIQLARPARTNPPTDPARTLTARMHLPPGADAVLTRACRDCHSHETRWPWYSNVAPISWFVIDHVNHGRQHFNYSDWAQYDADQRAKILKDICGTVREGEMPMTTYLWLHRDARVTEAEVATLCGWTERAGHERPRVN